MAPWDTAGVLPVTRSPRRGRIWPGEASVVPGFAVPWHPSVVAAPRHPPAQPGLALAVLHTFACAQNIRNQVKSATSEALGGFMILQKAMPGTVLCPKIPWQRPALSPLCPCAPQVPLLRLPCLPPQWFRFLQDGGVTLTLRFHFCIL